MWVRIPLPAFNIVMKKNVFFEYTAVFLILIFLILFFLWPLPLKIKNSLPFHKDPCLHLYSIWHSAKAVSEGKIIPDFNTHHFYPYGYTLSWDDAFIFPSFLFYFLYFLTSNMIYSFNLTFIIFWAFSGLCMYFLLKILRMNKLASFFGAFVYALMPYRTSYYVENNMQLCFGLPLGIAFIYLYYRERKFVYILGFLTAFILQAYSSWYYTVILSLLAFILFVLIFISQGGNFLPRRHIFLAFVFCLLTFLVLMPYAKPYFETHKKLGFERGILEMRTHSADVSDYFILSAGKHSKAESLMHQSGRMPHSENILSPGNFVYFYSVFALIMIFFSRSSVSYVKKRKKVIFFLLLLLFVNLFFILYYFYFGPINVKFLVFAFHLKAPIKPVYFVITFFIILMYVLSVPKGNKFPSKRIFLMFLVIAGFVFFIFSLGPIIYLNGKKLCKGIDYFLYSFLFPLHITRVLSRYGIVFLISVIILSSYFIHIFLGVIKQKYGVKRAILSFFLFFAPVFFEFIYEPYIFELFNFKTIKARYKTILEDKRDFAVLEFPANNAKDNSYYMLGSIFHKKYLINGWSGFRSKLFERQVGCFEDYFLQKKEIIKNIIFPLKYVVFNFDRMKIKERNILSKFIEKHPVNFLLKDIGKKYAVFEIREEYENLPVSKYFSPYFCRHKVFEIKIKALKNEDVENIVLNAEFNDFKKAYTIIPGETKVIKIDWQKYWKDILPNKIKITYSYILKKSTFKNLANYKINGIRIPGDLQIKSMGYDCGNDCSIIFNNCELALKKRGLNCVVISSNGNVLKKAYFDPLGCKDDNKKCFEFLKKIRKNQIVILSVKDDFSCVDDNVCEILGRFGLKKIKDLKFRDSYIAVINNNSSFELLSHNKIEVDVGKKKRNLVFAKIISCYEKRK